MQQYPCTSSSYSNSLSKLQPCNNCSNRVAPSLLDVEDLFCGEVRRRELGEQADQVQDDDERPIEVGDVAVAADRRVRAACDGGRGGGDVLPHGNLAAPNLLNRLLEDGHDITKVDGWQGAVIVLSLLLLLLLLLFVGIGVWLPRAALAHHEATHWLERKRIKSCG